MANQSVSVVVPGSFQGQRGNSGLNRAKQAGLTGTYWIKWRAGSKPQWARPFKDKWAASAAQLAKKRERRSGKEASTNAAPAISPPDRH